MGLVRLPVLFVPVNIPLLLSLQIYHPVSHIMYTFKASSLLSPDANEKHFQIWVKNQLQNYSGLTNGNIV